MCSRLACLVALAAVAIVQSAEQGVDNVNLLQKPVSFDDTAGDVLKDVMGVAEQVLNDAGPHRAATSKTAEQLKETAHEAFKDFFGVDPHPAATSKNDEPLKEAADEALKDAMGVAQQVLGDPAPHSAATSKTAEQLKDALSSVMPNIETHGNMKDGKGMSLKISFGNAKEEATPVDYKAAAAEYLAMTLFVVIGCGSAMAVCNEPGWVLQVALTFGLAITSLAYTVGHFSGGQINCAVTLGLVLAGKLSAAQGVTNFVAQMLGSLTGAMLLTLMIPEAADKTGGLGTNKIADKLSKVNAFVGEFIMTFLLMFVVLETAINPDTKANREMAALAIGFAVFLAHAVLINVDGCSINPTRTFGPAMVRQMMYKNKADSLDEQLVFWAGPLLGAAGAVLVSSAMR